MAQASMNVTHQTKFNFCGYPQRKWMFSNADGPSQIYSELRDVVGVHQVYVAVLAIQ